MSPLQSIVKPILGSNNQHMVTHLVYKKLLHFLIDFDQFSDTMYVLADHATISVVSEANHTSEELLEEYRKNKGYLFFLSPLTVADTIHIKKDSIQFTLIYHKFHTDEMLATVSIPTTGIIQMGYFRNRAWKKTEERFTINGCKTEFIDVVEPRSSRSNQLRDTADKGKTSFWKRFFFMGRNNKNKKEKLSANVDEHQSIVQSESVSSYSNVVHFPDRAKGSRSSSTA